MKSIIFRRSPKWPSLCLFKVMYAIAYASLIAFAIVVLHYIFRPEAHGLTPPAPLPAYMPGDDVVHWSKSGDGDYQTLEGKHCTVTDLKWDKFSRRIGYVVNSQGWGDFDTYHSNLVTRRKWDVMREEFMREVCYPKWWMPFVEGKDGPR